MNQQIALDAVTTPPSWFPANLAALGRRFERLSPLEVLRWALVTCGDDVALATGFGASGVVLMHMVSRIRPGTFFFYLQTDLLFPETMALRDRLAETLPIQFTEVPASLTLQQQSRHYGPELWRHNPDLCCQLRKVEPLRRFLQSDSRRRAWVTGIRRDQSPTRANIGVVDWDYATGLLKIAPLATWKQQQVWDYIRRHDLPYNRLHDQGYPSIGCMPCTQAISAGGQERDGRWVGRDKVECGIHVQPGGQRLTRSLGMGHR